jgi:RNA polymerase sigma-70 factor (ECF subfamily)
VGAFVAHIDASADFADEVRQQLRERLLVGAQPRIADYRGQGALGGWLRVAAVRTALTIKRAASRAEIAAPSPPAPDPELDFLKTRYRGELEAAFRATLEKLPADERNVLRLHYLDGCNIDEIGAVYPVHRSTVARWLADSRQTLLDETRRRLVERLDLKEGEIDSLIDLV